MITFDESVEATLKRRLPDRQQIHLCLVRLEKMQYSAHRLKHFAILYQQLLLCFKAAEPSFFERKHQTYRVHVVLLQICRDASPKDFLNIVGHGLRIGFYQRAQILEVCVSIVDNYQ